MQQVAFFKKSKCDFSAPNVTVTASQGQDYASFMFNRSNLSAWMTTGSVDSDNTNIVIDFVDEKNLTDIIIVLHNLKSYTIQYWDGATYQDFSTAISTSALTTPVGQSYTTTRHSFNSVTTTKIKMIITGTQTTNADKIIYQIIATELIGQLTYWPQIKKPTNSRNRQLSQSLSGKYSIREDIGLFQATLDLASWSQSADISIIERLFNANEGFLVWLCGGDIAQFTLTGAPMGYRMQDFFLMKCKNEYAPEFNLFIYQCGLKMQLDLVEVID